MQTLDLSPLPCAFPPETPRSSSAASPGFVDDTVVLALLTGATGFRYTDSAKALALPADEMNFAGWQPSLLPGTRFMRPA